MSEIVKTLTFGAVALVALLMAVVSLPRRHVDVAALEEGTELFPEFTDPAVANSLEIVKFDEATSTRESFRVAKMDDNKWVIPSHENYPADQQTHLGAAAASVMDLRKLAVVSRNSPKDHPTYGVIDPTGDKATAGATGVGMLVRMQDKDGKDLANLIIGKADAAKPDLRFVRIPNQDPVYRVEVKTDKFSTNFGDWIEKDLLQLSAFQVKKVSINDYSFDESSRQSPIVERGNVKLEFDNKESTWKLAGLAQFNDQTGNFEKLELAEDEELDTKNLNDLKSALDDLKIVDVHRKPQGLSGHLLKGEFKVNQEDLFSLEERGFHIRSVSETQMALLSKEGEVSVGTADGVSYLLRFGNISRSLRSLTDDDADKDGKAAAPTTIGQDRYIFVMAEFDESLLEPPKFDPLPGEEPDEKPDAMDDAAPVEEDPAEDDPQANGAANEGDGDTSEGGEEAREFDADKEDGGQESSDQGSTEDDAASDAATGDSAEGEESAADTKTNKDASLKNSSQEKAHDEDTDDDEANTDKATDGKDDGDAGKQETTKDPLAAERERITRANKTKQDEYDKKVKDGKKRVDDLNRRFAEWYYVISDETYKKVHLGKDKIVRKKAPPADDKTAKDGADADTPDDVSGLEDFDALKEAAPE